MPEKIFFAVDYSPYLINHQTVLQTTTELINFWNTLRLPGNQGKEMIHSFLK